MSAKRFLYAIVVTPLLIGSAAAVDMSWSVTVNGSPDAVWQKIGEFCAIGDWHPQVTKCELVEEGGNTFRDLSFPDNTSLRSKLTQKTDTSYSYEVVEGLPVKSYQGTFSVSPEGDKTQVDLNVSYEPLDVPEAEGLESALDAFYQAGMDAIAQMHGG